MVQFLQWFYGYNQNRSPEEEADPDDVAILGFGSYSGTAIAADGWEEELQEMQVPPASAGRYGQLFHETSWDTQILFMGDLPEQFELFETKGHRAISCVCICRSIFLRFL